MTLNFKPINKTQNKFEFEFWAEFGDCDYDTTEQHLVDDIPENRQHIEKILEYYDSCISDSDNTGIDKLNELLHKCSISIDVPHDEDYCVMDGYPTRWSMDIYYYDNNGTKFEVWYKKDEG